VLHGDLWEKGSRVPDSGLFSLSLVKAECRCLSSIFKPYVQIKPPDKFSIRSKLEKFWVNPKISETVPAEKAHFLTFRDRLRQMDVQLVLLQAARLGPNRPFPGAVQDVHDRLDGKSKGLRSGARGWRKGMTELMDRRDINASVSRLASWRPARPDGRG
jgi:hypothetical protein